MRRSCGGASPELQHRLYVGPHNSLHTVHACKSPQFVDRSSTTARTVAERLEGGVQSYLIAVLEAVGDRLGRARHRYSDLLDLTPFHGFPEGVSGSADDPQGNRGILRSPLLVANQYPDIVWQLGREFMELERG